VLEDSGVKRMAVKGPGILLAAVLLTSQICGCPYSFSGSSLPSHVKSIAIPVFDNESLDATIADEVTRGLLDHFLEDNRLKVVPESRADCVLEGSVTGYERRVYSYTPNQQPEEYIVVVSISVVLKDRVKNKDLWSDESLQATATYAATADASAGSADTEDEAREAAVVLLAQDILARTLEQW
jgi:hypothetical protein